MIRLTRNNYGSVKSGFRLHQSLAMKTEKNAATLADVEHLRSIIARAEEDLQRSMAAVMRARSTDDRADAFDALERARAALSHWLPSRLGN